MPESPRSLSLGMVAEDPRFPDPVCRMMVTAASAAASCVHNEKPVYFCSELCKRKFQRDPEHYLDGTPPRVGARHAPKSLATVRHLCPMCPEVESVGPASCPKCGMALDPIATAATSNVAEDAEYTSMLWRMILAVILGIPLLILAMAVMFEGRLPDLGLFGASEEEWSQFGFRNMLWLQLGLCTPIVLISGWPLIKKFFQSILARSLNMFTLIGLGVGVAYVFSVLTVVDAVGYASIFPNSMRFHAGYVMPYFESAGMIVLLVLVGQVLELRARHATGDAVRGLMQLTPGTATVLLESGKEVELPLEYLQVGDRIRVAVGSRIPVDGTVESGTAHVDESMLSGESIAIRKEPGSPVHAGTLNGLAPLIIRAEKLQDDTLLAQIVRLVGEAQRTRLPIQSVVDKVSRIFVPAVILIAVLTFVGWWRFSGSDGHDTRAIQAAVDVLVIACPCALGLATPMAVIVGVGRGAQLGILFRNAEVFQQLTRVTAFAFDKTGTLTEGKPKISHIETLNDFPTQELLRLAAAVERGTDHPFGRAIVWEAVSRGITIPPAENVEVQPGKGVRGTVDGHVVLVGSFGFSVQSGVTGESPAYRMNELRHEGATVIIVAVDGRYTGLIALIDPLRPTSLETVKALRAKGNKVILITGDHAKTAYAIARKMMLDDVISDALPTDKYSAVKQLQKDGHRVAMIGDGINDAPALAAADVGIALGSGTDIAMSAAGITLIRPDLRAVAAAIYLSHATVRTIRQNLLLAFIYNVAAIPIAALGSVPPIWAAAAMSLSSLSVILNSLRLRRAKLKLTG